MSETELAEAKSEIASLTSRLATGEEQLRKAEASAARMRSALEAAADGFRIIQTLDRQGVSDKTYLVWLKNNAERAEHYARAALAAEPEQAPAPDPPAEIADYECLCCQCGRTFSSGTKHGVLCPDCRSGKKAAPEPTIPLADALRVAQLFIPSVPFRSVRDALEALARKEVMPHFPDHNVASGLDNTQPGPTSVEPGASFQARVKPWMDACFGPKISADRVERNHRFIEEALELVQANGCTQTEAHQLVDYVYSHPQGDINQEVGGVMVTLAALCLANGIDMHEGGETELRRIWTKVDQIRAKQAAKPRHSPLPEAADGWIPWQGGECPVPEGTLGEVRFRDGEIYRPHDLRNLIWHHEMDKGDIIAYRVEPATSSESSAEPSLQKAQGTPITGPYAYKHAKVGDRVRIREGAIGFDECVLPPSSIVQKVSGEPEWRSDGYDCCVQVDDGLDWVANSDVLAVLPATPSPAPEPAGVDYEALGREGHLAFIAAFVERHCTIDEAWVAIARTIIAAYEAQRSASPQGERVEWRCFHCGEVFTSERWAHDHFGACEGATPACQIKGGEIHLVHRIRKLEAELSEYRSEDTDLLRAIHSFEADHRQALRREEEKGYERGLKDADLRAARALQGGE